MVRPPGSQGAHPWAEPLEDPITPRPATGFRTTSPARAPREERNETHRRPDDEGETNALPCAVPSKPRYATRKESEEARYRGRGAQREPTGRPVGSLRGTWRDGLSRFQIYNHAVVDRRREGDLGLVVLAHGVAIPPRVGGSDP